MATESSSGPMAHLTRVCTRKEGNTERASLSGQITRGLRENFWTITFTGSEPTRGQMDAFTLVNGRTTRWRGRENSGGLMGAVTKDSMSMIQRRAREPSSGRTVANTSATGARASSTARVSMSPPRANSAKEFGRMASAWSGSRADTINN